MCVFSISEAVDCNHRVIVWNLLEHWYWDNIYEVPMTVNDMELSWIILDRISGFENHINSAGAVTLNAFEKAYNHYMQGMKPLYNKQWGARTTTDWAMLAEDLVRLLHSSCHLHLFPFHSHPLLFFWTSRKLRKGTLLQRRPRYRSTQQHSPILWLHLASWSTFHCVCVCVCNLPSYTCAVLSAS